MTASIADSLVIDQPNEFRCHTIAAELARPDPARDAESPEPRRVVRLIERQRHRQLRNTRGQRLSGGADPAMVDDRGAMMEHARKRYIRFPSFSIAEFAWQLFPIASHKQRTAFDATCRNERRREELGGGAVGGAGSKENWR